MKTIYITSKVCCNIFDSQKHLGEIDDNLRYLKINIKEEMYVDIHLSSFKYQKFIPFRLTLPKDLNRAVDQVEVVDLLDENYLLIINPKLLQNKFSCGEKIFEKSTKNQQISAIFNKFCEINIKTDKYNICYQTPHKLIQPTCSIQASDGCEYFVLHGDIQEGKTYTFISPINSPNNYWEKISDSINFSFPTFNTLTKSKDLIGHCVIEKFKLTNSVIQCLERYSSYTQNSPRVVLDPQKFGCAFFDCIMHGNTQHARTFLTPALSSALDDDHLKKFFPKFDCYYKCPTMNEVYLLKGAKNTYYQLKFENYKIADITDFPVS